MYSARGMLPFAVTPGNPSARPRPLRPQVEALHATLGYFASIPELSQVWPGPFFVRQHAGAFWGRVPWSSALRPPVPHPRRSPASESQSSEAPRAATWHALVYVQVPEELRHQLSVASGRSSLAERRFRALPYRIPLDPSASVSIALLLSIISIRVPTAFFWGRDGSSTRQLRQHNPDFKRS